MMINNWEQKNLSCHLLFHDGYAQHIDGNVYQVDAVKIQDSR